MRKIKNIIFCSIILCVGLCFAAMSDDNNTIKIEEIEKNPGKYFDKE